MAFYEGLLGLERAPRPADAARAGAWYRLGDLELHLSIEPDPQNERSKRHIALEVEGLDAWRRTFEERGFATEDGRPVPGLRRFFVRDPAGNRLEFSEAAPAGRAM